MLAVSEFSLEWKELESRASHAAQLQVNGLLPSVLHTAQVPTISPVWKQTLQVTGAPILPELGSVQGSSVPLDAKNLVLLVMVKSGDGRAGVAVLPEVQPGAAMEQWHLLMDPGNLESSLPHAEIMRYSMI